MSRPSLGTDRVPIPFSAHPFARAWTAACLVFGTAVLAIGLGLALAERTRALRAPLAESVLEPMVGQVQSAPPPARRLVRARPSTPLGGR